MRVSGWRQQRLLAVAAVLAGGGTGAGVAAWSRYAKLVVVQTQDKAEMRAERHKGRRRAEENWRWAERAVRAEEIDFFCLSVYGRREESARASGLEQEHARG